MNLLVLCVARTGALSRRLEADYKVVAKGSPRGRDITRIAQCVCNDAKLCNCITQMFVLADPLWNRCQEITHFMDADHQRSATSNFASQQEF